VFRKAKRKPSLSGYYLLLTLLFLLLLFFLEKMPHTDYSTRTYEPTPYQMEQMREKIAKKASRIDIVARGFFIGLLEAHPNLPSEVVLQVIQDSLNSIGNEVLSFHEPTQNEIYAGEIYDGAPVTEEEEPQEQQAQDEEEEPQEQQAQDEEEEPQEQQVQEEEEPTDTREVIVISDDEEEEVVTSEEGDFDDQPGTPGAGMTLEGLETFLAGHVGHGDYSEQEETYSPPGTPGGEGYYDSPPGTPGGEGYYDSPPSTPGGEGYQESTHGSAGYSTPLPVFSEDEQDLSSSEDEPGPSPRARCYHSDSYLSNFW